MTMLNWAELGPSFYRQIEVYDLSWEQDIELKEFAIVGAKFGGHLARLFDSTGKILLAIRNTGQYFWDHITIHDSAGNLTGKVPWANSRRLAGFGWTSDECLVLLYEDAELYIYNVHGEWTVPPVALWSEGSAPRILQCEVLENSLVFLTEDLSFYYVKNIPHSLNLRPEFIESLRKVGAKEPPVCFSVIPAAHSLSGNLAILCSGHTGGLVLVQENEEIKVFTKIPFTQLESKVKMIAVSASGEYLGLYLEGGIVVELNSNFSRRLCTHQGLADPVQLVWCGTEALCTVYEHSAWLLDKDGNTGSLDLHCAKKGVFCVTEVDGMRVFTTEHCELWEKVHPALVKTLSFDSEGPNDLLLAYEAYIEQDSKSVDSIRKLKTKGILDSAVQELLLAAATEWELDSQEKFLKAAAFGKTFLDPGDVDASTQVTIVKHLKVLNNIRRVNIARPITYTQLQCMGHNGEGLIARLLDSHHHLLAKKISEDWKLKLDPIYIHWACQKLLDLRYSDEEMTGIITGKISACRTVSYTEIAKQAWDHGRRDLAIELLDNESVISRKVPLLIYMGAYEKALDRAIQSKDPDLIYLVIMKVYEEDRQARQQPDYTPQGSFIEHILSKPLARAMLLNFAKQLDQQLLVNSYRHLNMLEQQGHYYVKKAFAFSQFSKRLEFLTNAKKYYVALQKDSLFAVACNEQFLLFDLQKRCIKETGDRGIIDLSICDTIVKVLMHDKEKLANALASKFSVSEKRMWFLRVKAMAAVGDWPGIVRLSASKKKPPIGFKPFANVAIQRSQFDLASEFIVKVQDIEYQIEMLKHIKNFRVAAEIAIKTDNREYLDDIVKSSDDSSLREYIDQLLTQIK